MSNKDTKYQQQILFEELPKTASDEHQSQAIVSSQVIVDNDSWQEDEIAENEEIVRETGSRKPRWLLRTVAVLVPILVGVELYDFFVSGFQNTPLISGLYAILLACVLAVAGRVGFKEYLGLRQLKRNTKIKQDILQLIKEGNSDETIAMCERIHQRLPCDLSNEFENKWQNSTKQELSAAEIATLYEQQVLTVVDHKALNVIAKYSTESVVLVAVSPVAILDMALLFWRNVRMLDDLAQLYGIHLSYWSRIRLIKQVFVNMAYAGASELVADVGVEMIGADILGKVSARFAQGMGAGMLTARLGLKAIQECRPLPFSQNKPKLSSVRRAIVNRLMKIKS